MDKKLTDNEIVKALECCSGKGDCRTCPYKNRENCTQDLKLETVDLINLQKAENEKWQGGYMTQKQEIENLEIELKAMRGAANSYKAENKRLSTLAELGNKRANDYRVMRDRALKAEKEVERLKPFEDKFAEFNSHIRVEDMLVCANSLGEWLEFCDNLKSEAYKEFAERLKKQKYQSSDWSHGEHPFVVEESDIDNTLYDLVGDEP